MDLRRKIQVESRLLTLPFARVLRAGDTAYFVSSTVIAGLPSCPGFPGRPATQ